MDMFDDDDTLVYEPAQTAAIILTGGDEEAEKDALEVRWVHANPRWCEHQGCNVLTSCLG